MNSVDRVVEEHGVVAGPVLRVFLGFVGDRDVPPSQELAMKAVDLLSAAGPQCNVIDADSLIGVLKPHTGTGRLNTDVAVWVDKTVM
jgi:hypothetical protein